MLNSGGTHDDFFNIRGNRSCPFQRSSVGQLQIDIGITLIFVGKEARRQAAGEESPPPSPKATSRTTRTAVFRSSTPLQRTYPSVVCSKQAIKPIEESPQQAVARLPGAEKQRGKRGAERKRVKRGENNGDGNRNGELLIEPSGDSGNEGGGHKYSGENQRDAYHRARRVLPSL